MMLSTMLYALILGGFLAGSAHFLDRGLRNLGRPTRWVWVSAMAGIGLVPLAALFDLPGPGGSPPAGLVVPLEALYGIWDRVPSPGAGGTGPMEWFNQPLGILWWVASLLVVALFVGAALRLHVQSRLWPRRTAAGELLLISDGMGPAVVGLLKPRIVLPRWALSLEKEELEIILLHEAEHRRARDPALLAGGILGVALAPWNPSLWWCLRRLRLAVEGDCDGRVLARGIPRKRYGQLLLGVASGARGLFPLAPALADGGGTSLERRLSMMNTHVGKKRMGRALAAVVVGGFFLVLACETPTPPGSSVESEVGPDGALTELTGDQVEGGTLIQRGGTLVKVPEDGAEIRTMKENGALSETAEKAVRFRLLENPDGVQGTIEASPLIYVDGVRVPGADAKTVMQELKLNSDLIDRIEVIKGAAAEALFGPEAANGVIQIFMKK